MQDLVFPWLAAFSEQVAAVDQNKASASNCLQCLKIFCLVLIQDAVHAAATDPLALKNDVVVMHLLHTDTFQQVVHRYNTQLRDGTLQPPETLESLMRAWLSGSTHPPGQSSRSANLTTSYRPNLPTINPERNPLLNYVAPVDFFQELLVHQVSCACTLTNITTPHCLPGPFQYACPPYL